MKMKKENVIKIIKEISSMWKRIDIKLNLLKSLELKPPEWN